MFGENQNVWRILISFKNGQFLFFAFQIKPNNIKKFGHIFHSNLFSEFFEQAQGVAYMFREQPGVRMTRIWLGPLPFVVIYGAEEIEPILSSNKILTKMYGTKC
jgi:hypothetical protein